MGPTWVLSAPDGPHVGPMNFVLGVFHKHADDMTWMFSALLALFEENPQVTSRSIYKEKQKHYDDVIMTMLASQITSLTVVYSIVYSGVNQRKHQSSASLAIVRKIHRGPVNFPHKWPVTRKMFPFDDVIMKLTTIGQHNMMMSSNRNIFCITGPLWGESTGHRWIPLTNASDMELWCFLWSAPEQMAEQTIETPVNFFFMTYVFTCPSQPQDK